MTDTELKQNIVTLINNVQDESLLEKVYTLLNHTHLYTKVQDLVKQKAVAHGSFSGQVTDVIMKSDVNYNDLVNFIDNYGDGYIDTDKLFSGERLYFWNFVSGDQTARNIFNNLYSVTRDGIGAGEVALATLSSKIELCTQSDIMYNGMKVEVKASNSAKRGGGGGRLGETGLFNPHDAPKIFEKHTGIMPTEDIRVRDLGTELRKYLNETDTVTAAKEIFDSIFDGKVDTTQLSESVLWYGSSAIREYVFACWHAYKKHAGWDGILLLNKNTDNPRNHRAQFFTDPSNLYNEIYTAQANSHVVNVKNLGYASRNILPSVTLQ